MSRTDSQSYIDYPVTAYDELIGRFIVYDKDISFTGASAFDFAVSRSSNPTTLSAADWAFYKINNTESGYMPGNLSSLGYNADAVVFTANMYGTTSDHVQVVSIKAADLANAVASPKVVKTDLNNWPAFWTVRPTAMHGSVPGDPMWLVSEHRDNQSIDVIKMTGELTSSPSFTVTNLAVTPYSAPVPPLNPDGTAFSSPGSDIKQAAESNGTLVAAQTVGVSSTQDVIQWYAINVGSGSPSLAQQGRVGGGDNTYAVYPAIDINPAGQIGMTYLQMGTDTATDFMSMWVTARTSADAPGTMEPPVLVPAGTGQANYSGYRVVIGEQSGINIDPADGSFWAVNQFANTVFPANWGTAIAHFVPGLPAGNTDLAVTATGPSVVLPGATATYTITLTNNGPIAAQNVVLTDALPAGATSRLAHPNVRARRLHVRPVGQRRHRNGRRRHRRGQLGHVHACRHGRSQRGARDELLRFGVGHEQHARRQPGQQFGDGRRLDPGPAGRSRREYQHPHERRRGKQRHLYGHRDQQRPQHGDGGRPDRHREPINCGTFRPPPPRGPSPLRTATTVTIGSVTYVNGIVTDTIGSIAAGASVTLTVTAQALGDTYLGHSATATATSADPNPDNNTAFADIAGSEAPIVVSGPITTTSKTLSNFTVATFTHANGVEPASRFSATINWGDGTTSAGTITQSGTTYSVAGSHTYQQAATLTTPSRRR